MTLKCPECGGQNKFYRRGIETVTKILDREGDIVDDEYGDFEYDDDMECSECNHEADMDDFDTDNQPDPDEEDEEAHKPQNPDDIP